MLLDLLKIILD
jgi:hypothetical protein